MQVIYLGFNHLKLNNSKFKAFKIEEFQITITKSEHFLIAVFTQTLKNGKL